MHSAVYDIFSARQHIALCYRPSICPSVRPSHGWIIQKRFKLGLKFLPCGSTIPIFCGVSFIQKF